MWIKSNSTLFINFIHITLNSFIYIIFIIIIFFRNFFNFIL